MAYRSLAFVLALLTASCGSEIRVIGDDNDGGGPVEGDGASSTDAPVAPGDEGVSDTEVVADSAPSCGKEDCDGDGYASPADCNDRDPSINPDAYDFKDDHVDNDCDGTADNPVETCETGSTNALDFARAAELCAQRSLTKDGKPFDPVTKAEFGSVTSGGTTSTTNAKATQIVKSFGDNGPRKGGFLFAMQTGPILSTDPRGSVAMDATAVSNPCTAIPLLGADCSSLVDSTATTPPAVQDFQEVRLTLRVPSNAHGVSFDYAFFTTEFNEYWHSSFNDAFFALVTTKSLTGANVAKDAMGVAPSPNSAFMQICPKSPGPSGLDTSKLAALSNCVGLEGDAGKKVFGTLKHTNFDGAGKGSTDDTTVGAGSGTKVLYGGGTGWLTTSFAVEPGESVVIRFMIMDAGDGALDSATIVDNIRWLQAPPASALGETTRPPS